MKKKDAKKALFLKAIRHSRKRDLVGRPAVFKDRSKYDRRKRKQEDRKELNNL